MRFAIRTVLAFAVGVALVAATPAVVASATPIQHARQAHVVFRNGGLTIAIPLRPGRHVVSDAVALNAHSYSSPAAASSSPTIHVRVGPTSCAGYNGEITWEYFPNIEAWLINTYVCPVG